MTDTTQVTSTTDVLSKYNALVKQSLGGDSVYIRAKETVEEMFKNSDITSTDRASVMSTIISSMVNGITSSSMGTALEWAKYEKDIELKKLELDKQLAILEQERLLKEAQVDQVDTQNRLALVESKRMFGTSIFDVNTGALLSLSDEGKVWKEMEFVDSKIANSEEERILIQSKVKESKVAIHKVVADTYTNFGTFSYTYDSSDASISNVSRVDLAHESLSDTQQHIAAEQGKGYTYNAWANALTGSASILGTALASGDFDFSTDSAGEKLLYTVLNCATNLKNSSSAAEGALPVSNIQPA